MSKCKNLINTILSLSPDKISLTKYIGHSYWGGKWISASVIKK